MRFGRSLWSAISCQRQVVKQPKRDDQVEEEEEEDDDEEEKQKRARYVCSFFDTSRLDSTALPRYRLPRGSLEKRGKKLWIPADIRLTFDSAARVRYYILSNEGRLWTSNDEQRDHPSRRREKVILSFSFFFLFFSSFFSRNRTRVVRRETVLPSSVARFRRLFQRARGKPVNSNIDLRTISRCNLGLILAIRSIFFSSLFLSFFPSRLLFFHFFFFFFLFAETEKTQELLRCRIGCQWENDRGWKC